MHDIITPDSTFKLSEFRGSGQYEKLARLKARTTVVALDSCFSGSGGRSIMAKGARPLISKSNTEPLPEGIVALTAADKNQITSTLAEQGHGTFTYYLLLGLGGAAKNQAGHITLKSLHDFVTPKVQDAARLHNRDQTPQLLSHDSHSAETRLR